MVLSPPETSTRSQNFIAVANRKSSIVGRILYIQYTNPAGYPPLENSSRIFGNAGWRVLFLGTGSLGVDSLSFAPHQRIDVRKMAFQSAGWRQKLHYLKFSLWTLGWTFRWRPRWVYASDLLICPVALALSYIPSVRVIYHEHDSPSTDNPRLFQKLCLAARRHLARRADLCVLPNPKRAARFADETAKQQGAATKPAVIVWNCPSIEEVSAVRSEPDGGELRVVYHGTIVPSRLPLTIIDALATVPEGVKLVVIGYETIGHAGYIEQLKERARMLGVIERVEFLAPMSRKELMAQCSKYDVGLALMPLESEDINMTAMIGASNKPFDYLSSGLALLVSDLPDWRQMYVENGYGLACDPENPQSIANALRWYLEHSSEMRSMGERGRQKIATEWNYERKFQPVMEKVIES
jgi:glycosyltransferase involved in cell wall biosynthesis